MTKRKNRRAKRQNHGRPQAPRPRITLEQFAQTALAEYPEWQAVFVLATKPAQNPDDDNEENGELSCKFRTGYDLRLMVTELRGAADSLERAINQEVAAGDSDGSAELCDSCAAAPAVDFVSIDLAITDDEAENEGLALCEGCSSVVRESRDSCHVAKTNKPEDGIATGCALVELSKYEEGDDPIEMWILCGEHAAALSEWLHSTD